MGRSRHYLLAHRVLLFPLGVAIFLLSSLAYADDPDLRKFYLGAELGTARIEVSRNGVKNSDTWLYGALSVEYELSHRLFVGVEGAGWTDQIEIDDPISEDVFTLMLISKIFPSQDSNTFLKAGWGYAKHRYWEVSDKTDTSGNAYIIGVGIDAGIGNLSMSYSKGNLHQGSYQALTFSLGGKF